MRRDDQPAPTRSGEVHWHAGGERLREQMVQTVSGLHLVAVVAVATPMRRHRQERARTRCLQQLLWDLRELGVDNPLLESRRQRDQHDRRAIGHGIIADAASPELRYAFGRPPPGVVAVVAGPCRRRRCRCAWRADHAPPRRARRLRQRHRRRTCGLIPDSAKVGARHPAGSPAPHFRPLQGPARAARCRLRSTLRVDSPKVPAKLALRVSDDAAGSRRRFAIDLRQGVYYCKLSW